MENKSLLTIVSESVHIEQMLIESGGELTAEIETALIINGQHLAEKADGYHMIMERFDALESHYNARAEFFKQVSKQCKYVTDRLKHNIKIAMTELNTNEIKGGDIRFKLSTTAGKLIIEDEDMVPVEFKEEITTTKIKNDDLKKALSAGPVAGAKLEKSLSLRVFANTPDKNTNKKSKEITDV